MEGKDTCDWESFDFFKNAIKSDKTEWLVRLEWRRTWTLISTISSEHFPNCPLNILLAFRTPTGYCLTATTIPGGPTTEWLDGKPTVKEKQWMRDNGPCLRFQSLRAYRRSLRIRRSEENLGDEGRTWNKGTGKMSQNIYVFHSNCPTIVSIPTAIPMQPTKPEVEILLSGNNIDYDKAVVLLDTGSSGCFLHRSSPMLLNANARGSKHQWVCNHNQVPWGRSPTATLAKTWPWQGSYCYSGRQPSLWWSRGFVGWWLFQYPIIVNDKGRLVTKALIDEWVFRWLTRHSKAEKSWLIVSKSDLVTFLKYTNCYTLIVFNYLFRPWGGGWTRVRGV